jgi:proline dehydrogenase
MLRWMLLKASQSGTLRRWVPRFPPTRRAVRRFMPGERLADALGGSAVLEAAGLGTILTFLGENVEDKSAVDAVVEEYLAALDAIETRGLKTELSVKPTQLGLDLSPEVCLEALRRIAEGSARAGRPIWIDMESSEYVDVTLELFRKLQEEHPRTGVCLQAYLHRTPADLDDLLPSSPAIRLVKGAYREPAEVALQDRGEVDARFLALGHRLLAHRASDPGTRVAFGTHDGTLIEGLTQAAREVGAGPDGFEFQLLYGIREEEQRRLAAAGIPTRVLISYGDAWYPWYMRRLAERPANLLFVFRSLVSGKG